MDGDDRRARPQVGVADEGVELPAGFDDAGMNEAKAISLFRAVAVGFIVRVRQRGAPFVVNVTFQRGSAAFQGTSFWTPRTNSLGSVRPGRQPGRSAM